MRALLAACLAGCGAAPALAPEAPPAHGPVVVSAPVEGGGAALFAGGGKRITWGGTDVDPAILSDGRVLFATLRGGRFVLATVHPDGTGFALFHAAEGPLRRPRQLPSLDVACEGGPTGHLLLSWDAPGAPGTPLAGPPPAAPTPRPQGHLSVVREDRPFGTLYCVDARRGAPGAATVRVRAGERVLGVAPLAEDGSFHLRLPPDRPLRLELLDAAGAVVAAERDPIWMRPNEVRGCVGCHDDPETGPPNARPAAVARPAVDLLR